jgi:hypothetical protein
VLSALGLSSAAAIVFACGVGSVPLTPAELLAGLFDIVSGDGTTIASTLLALRLTRALAGFATGAMLALAGVMMQALLRNPLADPYVLGVSGGAAVGALAAMLLFGAAWAVDVSAFGGAVAVALLLYGLARQDFKSGSVEGRAPLLLLTGVIVAAGCGALVTLMLSVASESQLRGMVFWLIGAACAAVDRAHGGAAVRAPPCTCAERADPACRISGDAWRAGADAAQGLVCLLGAVDGECGEYRGQHRLCRFDRAACLSLRAGGGSSSFAPSSSTCRR